MVQMISFQEETKNALCGYMEKCDRIYVKNRFIIKKGKEVYGNMYLVLGRTVNSVGLDSGTVLGIVKSETLASLWSCLEKIKARNFKVENGELMVLSTVQSIDVDMEIQGSGSISEHMEYFKEDLHGTLWETLMCLSSLNAYLSKDEEFTHLTAVYNTKFSKSTMTVFTPFYTEKGWRSKKIMWFTDEVQTENMLALIPKDKLETLEFESIKDNVIELGDMAHNGNDYLKVKILTENLKLLSRGSKTMDSTYTKEFLINSVLSVDIQIAFKKGINDGVDIVKDLLGVEEDIEDMMIRTEYFGEKITQTKNLVFEGISPRLDVQGVKELYNNEDEEVMEKTQAYLNKGDKESRTALWMYLREKTFKDITMDAYIQGLLTGMKADGTTGQPDYSLINEFREVQSKNLYKESVRLHLERMNMFLHKFDFYTSAKEMHVFGGERKHYVNIKKKGY